MAKASVFVILSRLRDRWQGVVTERMAAATSIRRPHDARLAQEVRLSERNSPSLCSHPGPRELMPLRLRQLGLDPAFLRYARTEAYGDLERACATCRAWQRCARDLAKEDVQAGMNSYCLNAPAIDVLTVGWPALPRV